MIEITIVSHRLIYLSVTSRVVFAFLYLLPFRFLISILQMVTPIIIINVPKLIGYMK